MIRTVIGLAVLAIIVGVLALRWRGATRAHHARLDQLEVRIHVNGIRGKSTVTRLLGGVLREGGYRTVAKTTGSAARVIGPDGVEAPIPRRGAPTIYEQVDVVKEHVGQEIDALVIECMAVRPAYQKYSQDFLVKSDITVITNVREDHQEEMGETLAEIADSLSATVPHGGVLVTAEDRPALRERLAHHAASRGSRFVYADPIGVDDEELRDFDYVQFKENLAIGFAVARLLSIPREVALRGMVKSVPDVGVVRLHTYDLGGAQVLWVPLFAANDRESVILTFQALAPHFPPGAPVVGILNNRLDRGRRAQLFATMVPTDLQDVLDHVVTFGAYEDTVIDTMVGRGYPEERIHRMGDTVQPDLPQLLPALAALFPDGRGVLVGMVNIHTAQAEMLIEHFQSERDTHVDEVVMSQQPERAPASLQRAVATASYLPRHYLESGNG